MITKGIPEIIVQPIVSKMNLLDKLIYFFMDLIVNLQKVGESENNILPEITELLVWQGL